MKLNWAQNKISEQEEIQILTVHDIEVSSSQ